MEKHYPPFVEEVRKNDPELFEVVSKNMDLANQEGTLDAKTKILITMALDAVLGAEGGVKTLATRARGVGVSEEEIKETLRIAYMVSSNRTLIASLSAFKK